MILAFLLAFGCSKPAEVECSETVSCAFGEVCVDGTCEARSCATSDQCGIEEYCDSGSCVSGCQVDTDCKFGDTCDEAGQCAPAGCADTRTDCDVGEFCSPTGECYDAGGYFCKPCEADGDCGGSGNYCIGGAYCGVECADDRDCPAGFDCIPFSDGNGNIITYQCYTACWLIEE